MHPDRSRACCAPRRQQADTSPGGALNTGLMQGLIQGLLHRDRPVSLCLLVPRVYAADDAAAQTAQMSPSPESTSPTHRTLPERIGRPEFPDTGWDRIKDLFDRHPSQHYPEELTNVFKSAVVAAVAGFFYGGLPAARHARKKYIQVSQAEVYTSPVDAVRSAHNAAVRGFVRYGFRWSWRIAAFVTFFNSVSTGLSVYRDKYTLSHFAAAGAVTGGLFRLNLGLVRIMAGSILGAVLGIPAGFMIISMQSMSKETIRERRQRERRELYELKVAAWEARLQLTDDLIGDLKMTSEDENATKDLQRITELLSLPPNETPSDNARDSMETRSSDS